MGAPPASPAPYLSSSKRNSGSSALTPLFSKRSPARADAPTAVSVRSPSRAWMRSNSSTDFRLSQNPNASGSSPRHAARLSCSKRHTPHSAAPLHWISGATRRLISWSNDFPISPARPFRRTAVVAYIDSAPSPAERWVFRLKPAARWQALVRSKQRCLSCDFPQLYGRRNDYSRQKSRYACRSSPRPSGQAAKRFCFLTVSW